MRSRLILNLVLLAVVAALALVAVYRPAMERAPGPAPLTRLSADDVERIRLEWPGEATVVMERTAEGWRMVEPLRGRAAGFRARALAEVAQAEVLADFDAPAGALAQYGLDTPQATIGLNELQIALGDTNPVNQRRYVLHRDRVFLIADTQLTHASAKAVDLLDTRLFGDGFEPLAIHPPGVSLTRREGRWSADPPRDELDPDRITQFVDQWRFARALRVGAYDGPPTTETIGVEFRPAPGAARERVEIGIVRRAPETVLLRTDEGLAYHFNAATGERLLDPAAH